MKHLTFTELQQWQTEGRNFQLIDVRERSEHEHFNIGGLLIPLNVVTRHIDQLQLDRPIVFYCKRGIRSQIAIQRLMPRFPQADFYNLQDGILPLTKL